MPRSPAGCSKCIKELNEVLAVLWGPAENEEGEVHESNSPPEGREKSWIPMHDRRFCFFVASRGD